jgi:CHAT domain-containing protein/pimeloyl-ACP methyl ester carboxylesterase
VADSGSERETIEINLRGRKIEDGRAALPALLQDASRATGGPPDPFVNGQVIEVDAVYDLSRVARSGGAQATANPSSDRLLALEADDGTTLFMRADRLREELQRLYPDAVPPDGSLDLSVLHGQAAASRGAVDWVWSKLSVLGLSPDAIIDRAKAKARDLILERLGAQVKDRLEELCDFSASTLGARALMWAIESQLAGEPGLYRWRGDTLALSDRVRADDPGLGQAAADGPLLIFIHGTGSHTAGSFGDLRGTDASADWEQIKRRFGERVYGFEHRTFSESPVDNALMLAQTLPPGARLALVTHSRGGLVGDLLCAGRLEDALIAAYRPAATPDKGPEDDALAELREAVAAEEQRKLRELRQLLAEKDLRIERYVRVACPARGTALLSDNLDVFLSGLLSLMSSIVGAVAGPGASPVLSAFKRIVLEIADKRLDPHLVPGIEAMLTDAPMGALLARASRRPGIEMAVIAGDIEGDSLLKRLGLLFTDWMFFDRQHNDLVVDTGSMYAGLALTPGARYLFDQGTTVNHFSYFDNRRSREALRHWLAADNPAALTMFLPLEVQREPSALEARELTRSRAARTPAAAPDTRPVVILLPGIMGSHLELRRSNQRPGSGNRVWFDPLQLIRGGLGEIRFGARAVYEESLFQMFYGDLIEHLEQSHSVIRFPYDWRRPVQEAADRLAETVRDALTMHPNQPLRLLAHSMGGLVARAMIARQADLWLDMVEGDRPGGRFVMLGTPNHGSHLMVESLLGKSDTMRRLARIDLVHSLPEVLGIVAGFPGATQLLPRPGFEDSGGSPVDDYLDPAVWKELGRHNRDRWFGDGIVGTPTDQAIDAARELWSDVLGDTGTGGSWRPRPIEPPERVSYVFGQAENTACGITLDRGRVRMVGTPQGDGSVSWASGRLDFIPEENQWYMPAAHGDLANTNEYFPAIVELLQTGRTGRLGRLPLSRGMPATRTYDAGPVPYPTEEELVRGLMSSRPRRPQPVAARQQLAISVSAMDLRYAQVPLMCGHYVGDPISGAEAQIDEHLVGRALRQRERLGLYPAAVGTSAVVLMPRSEEETLRRTRRGALIVGLGTMGQLTVGSVTETVRAGVLRLLLSTHESANADAAPGSTRPTDPEDQGISLGSLLIGYNSTTLGSVENFVDAIILGVCEANRQFSAATQARLRVSELQFIEIFLDTAISAAHAVRHADKRLATQLRRLEAELAPHQELKEGKGLQPRLYANDVFGYWPRLMITDADGSETNCPPECYQVKQVSPIPRELLQDLLASGCGAGDKEESSAAGPGTDALAADPTELGSSHRPVAARLKYVFLSARARAETVAQQRQPGLVEDLVVQAIRDDRYNPDLARTLFQLLIPMEFKATARDLERLALVLDGYTANLPWEMLQADDEPLILKTAVVRQLASLRFRQKVYNTTGKTACVIADPSTRGYLEHFGKPGERPLPVLPGAAEEGRAVRRILEANNYQVNFVAPESEAMDVITRLFRDQYRILMVAAHGVYRATARDGTERTGVVLSNGVLLTAAEVGQLEVVPDVAFLNCCHLGKVDGAAGLPTDVNRLAYSLARELIEIGVRCVVVAGWAVNDQAARTFAETFFLQLVKLGKPFGVAVHAARLATYEGHPATNTWGAYQAYGDATFVLEPGKESSDDASRARVARAELLVDLARLRSEADHQIGPYGFERAREEIDALLRNAPPDWSDLPEVQAAIAEVYSASGRAGFEAARSAYLRAVAEEDKAGRVPVKAIEQLANLEARMAERLCDRHALSARAFRRCVRETALPRVRQAISRLNLLIELSGDAEGNGNPATPAQTTRPNPERQSLLGSAYKIEAKLLADAGYAWSTVARALIEAREAYRVAEGSPDDPNLNPYAVLNRLHLDALLQSEDEVEEIIALAERCKAVARRRFKDGADFWDAVTVVDADLVTHLVQGSLTDAGAEQGLLQAYREAGETVPKNAREFDSVVRQLRFHAAILRTREDSAEPTALERIAAALEAAGAQVRPAAPPVTAD